MRRLNLKETYAASGGSTPSPPSGTFVPPTPYFFCFQQGDITSLEFCAGLMFSCYNNALFNPAHLDTFLHDVFDPCNQSPPP